MGLWALWPLRTSFVSIVMGFFEESLPLFIRAGFRQIFAFTIQKVTDRFPQQSFIDRFAADVALDDRDMIIVFNNAHHHDHLPMSNLQKTILL